MDATEQAQIDRVLGHEFDLAIRGTRQDISAILAANSAKGSLRSGATIIQVCRSISERYCGLVTSVCAAVAMIDASPTAFSCIANAFDSALPDLEVEVRKIACMVSGRSSAKAIPSVLKAALERFDQFRLDVHAKLEIARFGFDRKSAPSVPPVNASQSKPLTQTTNRGGKPLAAHWDAMWAHIAVKLWTGDLQPKSQADVKRAMMEWFTAGSIEIGDTAVTERARQLWLQLEAAG